MTENFSHFLPERGRKCRLLMEKRIGWERPVRHTLPIFMRHIPSVNKSNIENQSSSQKPQAHP